LRTLTVKIGDWSGSVVISLYCPAKHKIVNEQFEAFFETLARFIVVGDYNAKQQYCESRLANPKGRASHKTIMVNLTCDFTLMR
jgi:hypothetical protein